jgi:hypothetical protein
MLLLLSSKVLHRIRGSTAHILRRVLKDNQRRHGVWTSGAEFFDQSVARS